jgi:hypothetical protein
VELKPRRARRSPSLHHRAHTHLPHTTPLSPPSTPPQAPGPRTKSAHSEDGEWRESADDSTPRARNHPTPTLSSHLCYVSCTPPARRDPSPRRAIGGNHRQSVAVGTCRPRVPLSPPHPTGHARFAIADAAVREGSPPCSPGTRMFERRCEVASPAPTFASYPQPASKTHHPPLPHPRTLARISSLCVISHHTFLAMPHSLATTSDQAHARDSTSPGAEPALAALPSRGAPQNRPPSPGSSPHSPSSSSDAPSKPNPNCLERVSACVDRSLQVRERQGVVMHNVTAPPRVSPSHSRPLTALPFPTARQ